MRKLLKRFLSDNAYLYIKKIYFVVRHLKMLLSKLFFSTFGITPRRYTSLHKLKGKYEGERCFIISMGPSLRIEDIERLSNEYTFAMNSIIKLFGQTEWRPSFYGIQDKNVYENLMDNLKDVNIPIMFASDDLANRFAIPNSWVQYPLDLLDHNVNFKTFNTQFSNECDLVVYDGYSITYSLLQLAVYMGFKEIYLLGNDCNYETPNSRFLDHGVKATDITTIGERMIAAYEVANRFAVENGIRIYNATRGGKLEVFKRINFDEVVR